ncbi:Dual specificity phosphatase, catalytic domain [Dillenia turbinata]|uniref:Dual specificity phosphatase, catalytic domain n=1 Tax=Dillenia turbinata TaxID=194707 RepID=A0AAN8VVY3_9MAGN
MLGQEDKGRLSDGTAIPRKPYLRSFSWTDRSPTIRNSRPQSNSKPRLGLPPLSISRPSVEEWPRAGSDDLGVWPHPPTPGGRTGATLTAKTPKEFEFKREKLAFYDKECSRIADHVYLGSDAVAKNREILRENGITHVLNCVGFACPEYFKGDLVYKTLWLQDSPSEDITSILYDVFDYFEDVREQGGRVFVHCCQGVSRSTSLVIAYLMWREGQSFEDAFQYVKAARGVTNPNMGFACQLLQCQKRVHAVPVSPSSVLRIYRMAPHSPYDPLHLVPKMLNRPGVLGLDSRGAFIVHVPSAIYVWIGRKCNLVMANNARAAAYQVVRYERAQGPIVAINEDEETSEFWDALASGELGHEKSNSKEKGSLSAGNDEVPLGLGLQSVERKVNEYDQDFDIFNKALAGGVVPPFPISANGSETCLPARENGWGRLRRKLASGIMKELVTSSKLKCEAAETDTNLPSSVDLELSVSPPDPSTLSSPSSGLSCSFSYLVENGPSVMTTDRKEQEKFLLSDPLASPSAPFGSPNSVSSFRDNGTEYNSKSPSLSPATSDYSSLFTFSPSSSNWSDLSNLSSHSSPSTLESTDPFFPKTAAPAENAFSLGKEAASSEKEAFPTYHSVRVANTSVPCKAACPSIAERRGSNPPPRMLLPTIGEAPRVPGRLARSCSFSQPDVDVDMVDDNDSSQSEHERCDGEEAMIDADMISSGNESHNKVENVEDYDMSSNDLIDKVADINN